MAESRCLRDEEEEVGVDVGLIERWGKCRSVGRKRNLMEFCQEHDIIRPYFTTGIDHSI